MLNHVRRSGGRLSDREIKDLAASFQEAVVDVLVKKAFWALEVTGAEDLVVAGGVACNSRLRQRLSEAARKENVRVFLPPPALCTDNGAMIASTAFHLLKKGFRGALSMNALPNWDDL